MQDNYVGDIGDYGKYGLLREVCAAGLSLAVNWYKVVPRSIGKQEDGKYTQYLSHPEIYRAYDSELFDILQTIVVQQKDRRLERIEQARLFSAKFYDREMDNDRKRWHKDALNQTPGVDVVFLDPDNGLETENMRKTKSATEKHVKWTEIKDYYCRGQNVILYQHRPQMTSKEKCIESVMRFQQEYLKADCVKVLEFPKYTNRFYFMFVQKEAERTFANICTAMTEKWSCNGFCREIVVR